MYDIKSIRENPQAFDAGLKRRGLAPLSATLLALDEKRRAAITAFEQAQARRNAASKEIGEAKKAKDEARASGLMAEVGELKTTLPALEQEQKTLAEALDKELAQIPNTPLPDVPDGADEHGNVEHHTSGTKRDYTFKPKQHFELGEALGQMDFELAAKLSGARFVVLQKGLARLERALGQFFLDTHTGEHGYTEVSPPLMVRDDVMFGTAQLPKFSQDQFLTRAPLTYEETEQFIEQLEPEERFWVPSAPKKTESGTTETRYHLNSEGLARYEEFSRRWLIPTAEVPLTNLVRESIVSEDELPLRLTACTPCFRAEAGAAGKDTRGMIRQHQFTKVELVSITTPDKSREEHERMLACAEAVLKKLDLHYRVVTLCTGDMGFASQKTYDIEVWLPGQGMYREISSCSVCGDFQARRMNARFRGKDGKPAYVHTLNGSGVAVGRALIAVMENYQDENGAIAVPDALKPYMGGVNKIEKK
ncbi:MAG TPA: serine--tRNA ligase [Pseudolabrys sp.]|nr:serine--tRNA ligase [Pseudolabrys sp.]HEV2627299.1 serine--tRNA ligase [Pseudolabrys sp.]